MPFPEGTFYAEAQAALVWLTPEASRVFGSYHVFPVNEVPKLIAAAPADQLVTAAKRMLGLIAGYVRAPIDLAAWDALPAEEAQVAAQVVFRLIGVP